MATPSPRIQVLTANPLLAHVGYLFDSQEIQPRSEALRGTVEDQLQNQAGALQTGPAKKDLLPSSKTIWEVGLFRK